MPASIDGCGGSCGAGCGACCDTGCESCGGHKLFGRLHGLFRAHQCQIIDFRARRPYAPPGARGPGVKGLPRSRWLKRLGQHDQLVEYHKPQERPERADDRQISD